MSTHLLYEHSTGYVLFDVHTISPVKLTMKSFLTFDSTAKSLEHMESISLQRCHPELLNFLAVNSVEKLVIDKSLEPAFRGMSIVVDIDSYFALYRHVKTNFYKLTNIPVSTGMNAALGHGYSRAQVNYNIGREDSFVIQSYLILDQLEKDYCVYVRRFKEIYSTYFPELAQLVQSDDEYLELANLFICKVEVGIDDIPSSCRTKNEIIDAKSYSVGSDLCRKDLEGIKGLFDIVIEKKANIDSLNLYLNQKLANVAPNLQEILGDRLSAKMITHGGGLSSLAKCPASTFQVLGAEKALFRALKAKTATPKYGFLFEMVKKYPNKGPIARFISAKCSIASRIDCYGTRDGVEIYGKALKQMINRRIKSGKSEELTSDVLKNATKTRNAEISAKGVVVSSDNACMGEKLLAASNSGKKSKRINASTLAAGSPPRKGLKEKRKNIK